MTERLAGVASSASTVTLFLLFGLAVWVIAKATERWSFFRERRDDLERVGHELVSRLRQGDYNGADLVLSRSPSIEASLVRPALDWIDGGPDAVEVLLEARRIAGRRSLEQTLLPIAIIARHARWLGALGTLIGLVGTFGALAHEHGKDLASVPWHGVSIGLVPVTAGIAVGLATSIAFGMLNAQARLVDDNVAILSKQLVAILRYKGHLASEFQLAQEAFAHAAHGLDGSDGDQEQRPRSPAELD